MDVGCKKTEEERPYRTDLTTIIVLNDNKIKKYVCKLLVDLL